MYQVTLGVIVGNRGFFPSHLCETGRQEVLRVLAEEGIRTVALDAGDTPFGSVETLRDAEKCAALFRAHRDEIDGIVATLPNFGDERGVSDAIRQAGLDVPVLVHAFPDENEKMTAADRRDSFCGKMSLCNNLRQYGIPFSLTALHTGRDCGREIPSSKWEPSRLLMGSSCVNGSVRQPSQESRRKPAGPLNATAQAWSYW